MSRPRNTSWSKLDLRDRLDHWLRDSPLRNQWIQYGPVKVYLRKGPIVIAGRAYNAITLANCDVRVENQGKGWIAEVLIWMEEQINLPGSDYTVAKIESVITPRMDQILERHGWLHFPIPHGVGSNYVKMRRMAGA